MKCHIIEIAIFDKDGNKRGVDNLKEGFNVITGDSQTGKSALLEIVDYCLLASRSTIPRGKIVDFAYLFAVVLELEDKYIVLGRPAPNKENSSKMFFKIEYSKDSISDLQKSYFDKIYPTPIDTLKIEFGRYFGFDVTDITLKQDDPLRRKEGRASFRNVTPYLFQHQSLIANKHAILYRFDDPNKRERIISEFPIFMGWVGGEYYALHRELVEKERRLLRLRRELNEVEKNKEGLKKRLEGYIESYYKIVGVPFPQVNSISYLEKLTHNLPEFTDNSYITGNFEEKLVELEQERDELADQKSKIERRIKLLDIASDSVDSYNSRMLKFSERSEQEIHVDHFRCPLCSQEVKSFNETVDSVIKSRISLFSDLQKLKKYSLDNSETIERLNQERDEVKQNILIINGEIKVLNRALKDKKNNYNLKEKAKELRSLIELSSELMFGKAGILYSDIGIKELNQEIDTIKNKLGKYNIDLYRAKFDQELRKDMNRICSKLDFEEELGYPNLKFYSNNFNFYHELSNGDKISLSEMGSGANWLTCHLSLLLGLHKQFAVNKKCSVPSFIFFDQPSQVYFPKEFNSEDEDVKNVVKIYDVIIETIKEIETEAGFKPQVIVTDHADDLKLNNGDFNSYVRRRWYKGRKLI